MAVAHLHPIQRRFAPRLYELRIGPDGWRYGLPGYTHYLLVLDQGEQVAEIRGLARPIGPSHWRAVRDVLRAAGFVAATFERRHGSRVVLKHVR